MIGGLQRFFDALRDRGIRTSPAERVDALRAVEEVGVEQRARFRRALEATLVKHASQRAAFDETFERFFAAPARGRGTGRDRGGSAAVGQRERPSGTGPAPPGSHPPRTRPAEPERDARPRPAAEPAPARRTTRAARLRDEIEALREGRVERRGRMRRAIVADRHASVSTRATRGPIVEARLRDLRRRRPGGDEQKELARTVRRLVERIRLRSGRRYRRRPSGRPYLRRVFRDSLATGGVPFRIPRRRRRLRTPRVVLIVDVSWSTAAAAGLFLEMACEFLRLGRQTRVILFVDRPVEVTARIEAWRGRERARPFVELLRSIPDLNPDAASDYGRLFHSLLAGPGRPRGRRTLLLLLGDGRTNVFDPLDWAFGELAEGCGAVIWLVPEPLVEWGTGDSALPVYLRHVDTVVEAGDLAGLARGVAELVHRL